MGYIKLGYLKYNLEQEDYRNGFMYSLRYFLVWLMNEQQGKTNQSRF